MYMILSEFIYGGMDGVITTVAIIAGILGANIAPKYALVLGLASLLADGFSMGISRYSSLVDVRRVKVSPLLSGLATFVSFVVIGAIPLAPFLFLSYQNEELIQYWMSLCSVFALLLVGVIKGFYTKKMTKTIIEVLVIGLTGVYISFQVARYVRTNVL